MEYQSSLDPAVLSGFADISNADLQNFLNLDLPDVDFDAYLNLDNAEMDTNMTDFDGRLSLPGPAPLLSIEVHGGKSVMDPLSRSYAWTEGNNCEPQSHPANERLNAPQALMSKYQTMHPSTQGQGFVLQPVPGVIYDSRGCVVPSAYGVASTWEPCSPPPQLTNSQVVLQATPHIARAYMPGYPGKQTIPFAEGHLPSLAPQIGNPTLMQGVQGSSLNAGGILQGQVNKLPLPSFAEADKELPVPKVVAIDRQTNPKSATKPSRVRKPLLLTKPNPRYAPHPKYNPLPQPPTPWSIYTYSPQGELTPSRLYTPLELHSFLFFHPRPHALVLRIHRNAPDSRHRYPTTHSHRCRFSTCPMYPNNTINQGHIAVSISEDGDGGEGERDPFLVVGWVHLWCAERFLDFVRVGRELNVGPDRREMKCEKRGKNPFMLATAAEEKCVDGFIKACKSGVPPPDYPHFNMPNRPHEGTLTHRLACIKLKREPSGVGKQRDLREKVAGYRGSTLDVHVGNLEVERRVRGWTRRHGNQNQVVVKPMVPRKYRGVRFVRGGEQESGDEEEEDEDAEGETEDEGEEPGWVKAAREPVFECRVQKRGKGKKVGRDGVQDDRIAEEQVESSDEEDEDEDEDSNSDSDSTDTDALEQQEQEQEVKLKLKLKNKRMTRSRKRANPDADSDEEDSDDDDVVVPSRKRVRR